jgi:hypothetical protein
LEDIDLAEIVSVIQNGGLTYTFLKHHLDDSLNQELTLLYTRLVDLGMEYRGDKVYLADLEEKDVQV